MRCFQLTALARFAAMALAVLWCVQPFTLVLHARTHAHRFCLEHNAFEEGQETAGQQPTVEQARSEDAPASVPPHTGGHGECSIAAATFPEGECAPGSGRPLLAGAPPRGSAAPTQAVPAPLRILHVAPKGSPPRPLTSAVS